MRRDVERLRGLGYPVQATRGGAGYVVYLEQVLPTRLRRRADALSAALATLPASGPTADPEALTTLAVAHPAATG